MPERKIEHVLFDPKNPTHREHLKQLTISDELEVEKDNAISTWAFNEKIRETPFDEYISKQIEKRKKELDSESYEHIGSDVDNKESFVVLQYLNGEPVGHAEYMRESGSDPYLEFLFVKPEMRDTLSDPKPRFHDDGSLHSIELNKTKRKEPLLLAKQLIEFIAKREGKPPHAHGNTERGMRFVEKYLLGQY